MNAQVTDPLLCKVCFFFFLFYYSLTHISKTKCFLSWYSCSALLCRLQAVNLEGGKPESGSIFAPAECFIVVVLKRHAVHNRNLLCVCANTGLSCHCNAAVYPICVTTSPGSYNYLPTYWLSGVLCADCRRPVSHFPCSLDLLLSAPVSANEGNATQLEATADWNICSPPADLHKCPVIWKSEGKLHGGLAESELRVFDVVDT